MKFFNMWSTDCPKKPAQDLSRTKEKVYLELKPYQVDADTGEMLNESSEPKLVENGFVDVDEQIQSYRDDCDIYKMLERVVITGNYELLHQNVGEFADIADLPDNIHDFKLQLKEVMSPEFKEKLKNATADPTLAAKVDALEKTLSDFIKANGIQPEAEKGESK